MVDPVAVFAYAFPHRKTHDFILELVTAGWRNLCVIGAPWKKLEGIDGTSYIPQTLRRAPALDTRRLCESLNVAFVEMDHHDAEGIAAVQRKHRFELGIIAGARILRRNVIGLFGEGIVNFHPGKIPETSGLNAFFYSIQRNVPMGVTAHLIDFRVDAGRHLFFDELVLGPDDSAEAVQENLYQAQILALRRFVRLRDEGPLATVPIDRPKKNDPMQAAEKWAALRAFPRWRAYHYQRQQLARLFAACDAGDAGVAEGIVEACPAMLEGRDDRGRTPLIAATARGQREVVERLLKKGADPNGVDGDGRTPVMHAAEWLLQCSEPDPAVLDLLFKHGADAGRRDCAGRNVLDYAKDAGNARLASYFEPRQRVET